MKILFVISGLGFGGSQRVVTLLANNLVNLNHNVEIVTVNYPRKPAYPMDERVTHINYNLQGLPGFISLNVCLKLRKAIRKSAPDLVVSFISEMNTLTIIAMGGMTTPLVVSERNNPYQDPRNIIKRRARDVTYHFADGFVFQTTAARNYFNDSIQSISTVILNPLDTKQLPDVFRGKRDKRIVAVSKLWVHKNIPLLIKAFSIVALQYPDYELNIYGEGPLKQELTLLADSLGVGEKIIFFGNRSDVLERISSASMFVLSSDYEGMPNALIEAMAMGLPSIATDCPIGGPAMLIEHGINGVLVPVNDHKALAHAMLGFLDDPIRAGSLGEEAVKIRERVDAEKITSDWENYLNLVLCNCNK